MMIKLVTEETKLKFFSFTSSHPAECVVIEALARCFGFQNSFSDFWLQTDDRDSPTACIARIDSTGHFFALDIAVKEEFLFFLYMQKFTTVTTDQYSLSPLLAGTIGYFLKRESILLQLGAHPSFETGMWDRVSETPPLDEFYDVLCESFKITVPYAEWRDDMRRRIQSGTGRVFGIYEKEQLISTCCILSQTPKAAYIGGVSTRQAFRRRKYASVLVSFVCQRLLSQNRLVFLSSDNLAAVQMYTKMGFFDRTLKYVYFFFKKEK